MTVEADLDRLLTAATPRLAGSDWLQPPPHLRPTGADDATWLAAIHAARAQHDAHALEAHARIEHLSGRLFDQPQLPQLPAGAAEGVDVMHATVRVETSAQLRDLVGDVDLRLPVGSPPPLPAPAAIDVQLRITVPRGITEPLPAIVRCHGGAYWMGGGDVAARLDGPEARWLARALHAVVVDVDYRLAPEFPYPAAIVDLLATLDWLRADAAPVPIDAERIAVLGVSSGGGTVAIACVIDAARVRDAAMATPPLAAQVLVVPSLDLRGGAHYETSADARAGRERQIRGYLGPQIDAADPFVSPVRGAPARGLPPTLVITGSRDDIARGGESWAASIVAAGGSAVHREHPMTHTVRTPATNATIVTEIEGFLAKRLSA